MTQTSQRPDWDSINAGCPVHSGQQQALSGDQIDWAGLPINLDFAFSRKQRDKVYVQHLMRKRGAQLWRVPDTAHLCVCEASTEHGNLNADAARDYV